MGEVGKDPLTWAAALEDWEDGGGNVVCALFVCDLPYTVGIDQQVLPVGVNGHLSLQVTTRGQSKRHREHNDHFRQLNVTWYRVRETKRTRPKPGLLALFIMYPGNNPINGKNESSSFQRTSMAGSLNALHVRANRATVLLPFGVSWMASNNFLVASTSLNTGGDMFDS